MLLSALIGFHFEKKKKKKVLNVPVALKMNFRFINDFCIHEPAISFQQGAPYIRGGERAY